MYPSEEALRRACSLLQLKPLQLFECLTKKTIQVPGQKRIASALNSVQAAASLAALTRSLYSKLFDFLVHEINQVLFCKSSAEECAFIGFLDIFGFEILETNSFEQLCINFVNEKLQGMFNAVIFDAEIELYTTEGLDFKEIHFADNKEIVQLLNGKLGLFNLLDETCRIPNGNESLFWSKCVKVHSKTSSFQTVPYNQHRFTLAHFAGNVTYTISDFVAKNKDDLGATIGELLCTSELGLLRKLYSAPVQVETKKRTQLAKFRRQLQHLLTIIDDTEPHFVRCIKPNNKSKRYEFVPRLVYEQLSCSGIFEAINIKKQGFPFRVQHNLFLKQYGSLQLLLPPSQRVKHSSTPSREEIMNTLTGFLQALSRERPENQPLSHTKVGLNLVFYRAEQHVLLEKLKGEVEVTVAVRLQSISRRFLVRCFILKLKEARGKLVVAMKSRDLDLLTSSLAYLAAVGKKYPYMKLPNLSRSKQVLVLLEREASCFKDITDLSNQDLLSHASKALELKKEAESLNLVDLYPTKAALVSRFCEQVRQVEPFAEWKASLRGAIGRSDCMTTKTLLQKLPSLRRAYKGLFAEDQFGAQDELEARASLVQMEAEERAVSGLIQGLAQLMRHGMSSTTPLRCFHLFVFRRSKVY